MFTLFLSTSNGTTSTQCSFTADEERVLKKFSKWFEFVFLFTLEKNSILIMLCKFLFRLRVWEWLRFSVVLIPASCKTSFPSDVIFLTCSSTMTGQLKWHHTLQVVAPLPWLSRYLPWFSVLWLLFYLFWPCLGYQRVFPQWHWIQADKTVVLSKAVYCSNDLIQWRGWKACTKLHGNFMKMAQGIQPCRLQGHTIRLAHQDHLS